MREYQVSKLTGNEILAKPIYLENGQILLESGTQLKTSYKESLNSLNVEKIFVEDSFEKYEHVNYYISKEFFSEVQQELKEIISHHIYKNNSGLRKVESLADKLLEEFISVKEVRVLDLKDRTFDLYEHVIYTTIMILILGKYYKFSKKRMKALTIGGLIHDLGFRYVNINYSECYQKIMSPVEIFELRRHTILAYTALETEDWIPEISKKMILFHHEKLDGTGFPLKQRNKEIECRMIQICDTFDSAVCEMKNPEKSISRGLEMISDEKKYDKKLFELIQNMIGYYPVGTFVKLDNDKQALVVSQTVHPCEPKIIYEEELLLENPSVIDLSKINRDKIVGISE